MGSLRARALQPDCRGSNAGSVVYVNYVILVSDDTLGNLPQFSHLQKGEIVLHHRVVRVK